MKERSEKLPFNQQLKSMLKVDFRRMFTMPLIYIMVGCSFVIPILILVMTSSLSGTIIDPTTGEETIMEGFTNVWQSIGSYSDASVSMDLVGMCNINLLYFLVAIFICIFISDDFKSGYAKNLFTIRAKKTDYVISKTLVGFTGGVMMILAYFCGAMLGGAIANLSFDSKIAGLSGISMCMIAKIFLMFVFVSIDLVVSVVGKQRLWLSILGSLCAGMLLFTMIPMMTPLDSSFLNVILCFAGGMLFAFGLGTLSNLILRKTSLV